jgi:soluble lytic murein transglycosylase-like protein
VKAKREVPTVVASPLFSRFPRSFGPLGIGALLLSLAHPAAAQVPVPENPPAVPAQTAPPAAAPAMPANETPAPPPESSPAPSAGSVEALQVPPRQVPPDSPAPAPATSPKKPSRPRLDFDESLGKPKAPFAEQIYEIAVRHAINPHLVAALVHVESAFNPRAVSRKGACGLMQLLPETARRFGLKKKKEIFDPVKNLEAGIRYLKWLNKRFNGDVHRVLAAYNAGEGAVDRFGGIPPYRETQQYVRKILGILGFTGDPLAQAEPSGTVGSGGEGEAVPAGR